jgi:predicted phosphodiesterase
VKQAIVSDIHANLEALEAVLADIEHQAVDEIICLGDVLLFGPNPRECLDRALIWPICLLGESDSRVRDAPDTCAPTLPGPRFSPRRRTGWEAWTKDQLRIGPATDGKRRIDFLNRLEPTAKSQGVLLVHGSPRNPLNECLFPEDVYNERVIIDNFRDVETHCFCGSSHIPGVIRERCDVLSLDECAAGYPLSAEKTIINVGSVGQPRDGDWRACYAILDDKTVHFRRVDYPFDKTLRKLEKLL